MPAPSRLVVLGAPVAHSLSPRMQGAALKAAGIDVPYDAVHVEPAELARVMRALASEGAGGNVTVPHKEAAAAICDELTPVARRVGAVNTFWSEDGKLIGENTDVGGFDALARMTLGLLPYDARIAVLGAGGAAAAVLIAASTWPGASVRIHSRRSARAQALTGRLGIGVAVHSLAEAVAGADIIVNATPLGLAEDDPFPVPLQLIERESVLLDLVYRAGGTAWVCAAHADGRRAADGLGMLVEQGALAFVRWFGIEPDREVMWHALS